MNTLLKWALGASVLTLAVLTLRALLGQWLSSRARYALWLLVLARLLIPAQLPIVAPVTLTALLPDRSSTSEAAFPSLPAPVPAIPDGSAAAPRVELAPPVVPEDIAVTVTPVLTPGRAAVSLWAAGAVVSGGVLLALNGRFSLHLRKRRRPLEVSDCPLPVYAAEGLPSPCLFGLFRPAVYLTPEAAALPGEQRRHILAHELTHHAHRDHIWSILRCAALALHWYNPLVWLAVALSKADGELACDEGAVKRLGENERVPYGRTLIGLSVRRTRPADLLQCSTAMTGGKNTLRNRVTALARKPETRKTALFAAASLLALAAVFTFAGPSEGEGDCYDSFLDRAESAQTLQVSEPLYSSFRSPDIVDEDLVEEGRGILRRVERSPDTGEWAGADFPNIWMECMGLTLDGTYRYALYDKDGTWYVLEPRTPEQDSYTADDYYIVGTLPQGMTAEALGSLGRRQYKRMDLQWQTERLYEALDMPAYIRFTGPFAAEAFPNEEIPNITDADLLEQAVEALRDGELQDGSSVWEMGENYWGAVTVRTTAGWQVLSYNVTNLEMCRALYDLAREQAERNRAADAFVNELTQEQLDRANEAFRSDQELPDGSWGPTEISCFFTSSYADPTQIDLEEFLSYCPIALNTYLENDEVEEFRAVMRAAGKEYEELYQTPLDFPTPVHRYPREKVSALLQKYAGVTVEELDWPDSLIYLEEYDAFYNFTSDYGPGTFYCTGGRIEGDVILWSDPHGENGARSVLTLRSTLEGDKARYLIQSFQSVRG